MKEVIARGLFNLLRTLSIFLVEYQKELKNDILDNEDYEALKSATDVAKQSLVNEFKNIK